jgi:hypothetical protein
VVREQWSMVRKNHPKRTKISYFQWTVIRRRQKPAKGFGI